MPVFVLGMWNGSGKAHLASDGTLVGRLALDGEGNTVGGLGLDLEVG